MKKKNKGFTLIELLAVIVILGLLMAIAIPSVTRYITQSRKKTLTTTIGNYMGALVNEVNSLEYTLTESNTVYAVPIECIALERGGNNPLGEWRQANDKYWAYVLVQYDDVNSSYKYGFTFKDSSGYGLYPTAQNKLSNSDKNVRTGLSLTRPKNGKVTTITDINNWGESGFAVDTNTNLVVLVAESEGKFGNGKTTCTLQQKGSNYAQVEEEKKNQNNNQPPQEDEWKGDAYALVLDNSANPDDELPMIFVRSETPIKAGDTYNSDRYGNITVKDAYTGFETTAYNDFRDIRIYLNGRYLLEAAYVLDTPWSDYSIYITSVVAEDKVRFTTLGGMFQGYVSLTYADVGNIDTSNNTNLAAVFLAAARWIEDGVGHFPDKGPLTIVGLDKWDTSKVTDMNNLFALAQIQSLGDVSGWDTSNVTNMAWTFGEIIYSSDSIIDISNWNVDKVTEWGYFNHHNETKIIPPVKFNN